MIDIESRYLGEIMGILRRHVPSCEVRAFGSRVAGKARKYSDLDLAILGKSPLDWATQFGLREAFSESDLPIIVDVVDWHQISDAFRSAISAACSVIQPG